MRRACAYRRTGLNNRDTQQPRLCTQVVTQKELLLILDGNKNTMDRLYVDYRSNNYKYVMFITRVYGRSWTRKMITKLK